MASASSSKTTLRHSTDVERQMGGLSNATSFTFQDFLPEVRKRCGFFSPNGNPSYSFRTLIDHANEWLHSNREWKIVTCESIKFKTKGDETGYTKMIHFESGEAVTFYIRGLRLWLRERTNEDETGQQIDYQNLIPHQLKKEGVFSPLKYETLDGVIKRFNLMLHSDPLPGRVITIESQQMSCSNFQDFDPDCSLWYEDGKVTKFLFFIRVFYEVMADNLEEIGIKDFAPDLISRGGACSAPEYELFSSVINKASDWCSQQQKLRFCNAQSVEFKLKKATVVNSKKMDYVKNKTVAFHVRILRVSYTKPQTDRYCQIEKPPPFEKLTCKSFVPEQLTSGVFFLEYENLHQTKKRVSAWIKATGAHVVSAETSALEIMSSYEIEYGTEPSFTYKESKVNQYRISVIRLYLDGIYREPPAELLPPLPRIKDSCCLIL